MSESAVGFLILGIVLLGVLVLVFVISMRTARDRERPKPPPGVHLPSPSPLPVIMSLGALLIGAGLTFKPDEPMTVPVLDVISGVMHPVVGPLGILVLLYGIWGWVRAAGHEWHEAERGAHGHDDAGGH
ncbi:MAG TPA: hypothetical protein VFH63_10570 [candidate division Zixibacteria bacterium]|nr:hypothetical protein [candidate division Zixibacteria bacterium]